MVLRLDPSIPMVWRTPTSVQFGAASPQLVLEAVTPGHERMLAALEAGVSLSGWEMLARAAGLDSAEASDLRVRLEPLLVSEPAPRHRRALVVGEGAIAGELADQLADAGLLASAGDPPGIVVLVAAWVISPDDHGTWLRRDVPHLPVVAADGAVAIGPFVEPGRGPCLYCVHLDRVDADPAWPAIATQLWGRHPPLLSRTTTASAASFAARLIAARIDTGPMDDPTEWRLAADGSISAQERRPHPMCSCATPPEIDWAPAADRESLHATTTSSTASAPG